MSYVLGTSLIYLACVLFFHADGRRTWQEGLKTSATLRRMAWGGGAVAAILAFLALRASAGIELAVPYWLGLATAAGAISLFVSSLAKAFHLPSAIAAAIVAIGALGAGLSGVGRI